jgi:transposase InsO family protein
VVTSVSDPGKPARPSPRAGLRALTTAVNLRGLRAISGRTYAGRALRRWRSELEVDLGGADALSAQQRALVDQACRTRLLLDSIDAWLLEQQSIVDKRHRRVVPIVRERKAMALQLANVLAMLGLARQAPPAPGLADVLGGKGGRP